MTNSSYFTRVAAVTGSNRGLGFEFVKQLSSDDSTLVIAFVRSQTESLEKLGRENIKIVKMDAANPESIAMAAKEAEKVSGGKIDLLINNAALGHGPFKLTEEKNLKPMADLFEANVMGPSHVTRELLPLLRAGKEKKIVFLSSGMGAISKTLERQMPSAAPYSVSKAAIDMVAAYFSNELYDEGFCVIAQDPGHVLTDMGGPSAPLTPEESIGAMLGAFKDMEHKDTGKFLEVDGPHGNIKVQARAW